jgi:hypothetical protein
MTRSLQVLSALATYGLGVLLAMPGCGQEVETEDLIAVGELVKPDPTKGRAS